MVVEATCQSNSVTEAVIAGMAGMGGMPARTALYQLPAFRPVALKFLKMLANEEAEVQKIAALLRSDPALGAEVLTVANSAGYGHSHHVDNLVQAIMVLGFEKTKSLTLTIALKSFLGDFGNAKVMKACWRHSLAAALVAEQLAELYGVSMDQAYTAGLMHDVGRLGLLMIDGERYAPALERRHRSVGDCLEAERGLFHMDHCQAGLWMTQKWGFPTEFSRVAGCHHEELAGRPRDLASLACAACLLADALGYAAVTCEQAPSAAEIAMQLPASPWNRYNFKEVELGDYVATQIALVDA
jgi:putative nucleotidyltransferase with HDIG domain